jgi:hypothetical protein
MASPNISARFGPTQDSPNPSANPDFPFFYRGFVAQLFGFDAGPPSTASLRASKSWAGTTRIVPLSYLDAIALPGDYPLIVADDPGDVITDEAELQAHYETNFPIDDLVVSLPASGPPIVSATVTGVVRKDMCRLAAARAIGLDEIAIRVRYV